MHFRKEDLLVPAALLERRLAFLRGAYGRAGAAAGGASRPESEEPA
jgi:hypothetical protein